MIAYRHKLDCGCWLCYSAEGNLVKLERCIKHQQPQMPKTDEWRN